jgi:glutathione peroxidase
VPDPDPLTRDVGDSSLDFAPRANPARRGIASAAEPAAGLIDRAVGVARDMSIHDSTLTTIRGDRVSLADYRDKVTLIVNVASRCGLTPQYAQLEQLQRTYGERGFAVLGFPSDDFQQEPGSREEIETFCSTTYGVTFPMFDKVAVNGPARHPLFAELTEAPDSAGDAGDVRWNFEKFLVTPAGDVHRFRSGVDPLDPEIVALIEASLPQSSD